MKKKIILWALGAMFCFTSCTAVPSACFSSDQLAEAEKILAETPKTGTVIASGGGFDGKNFSVLLEESVRCSGKDNPKVLYIPTAGRDSDDDDQEERVAYEKAGYETKVLFVSKESAEECKSKIEWADIIYAPGGNLGFLTEHWKAKGVDALMKEAFHRGAVLLGSSSGAMCWAERGWDDFYSEKVFRVTSSFPFLGMDNAYGYCDCVGILPFCLCPHYDNIAWRLYAKEAKKLDIPSLCVENGAAIKYTAGHYTVLHDPATPKRKAYVFAPEYGVEEHNLEKDASIADTIGALRLR